MLKSSVGCDVVDVTVPAPAAGVPGAGGSRVRGGGGGEKSPARARGADTPDMILVGCCGEAMRAAIAAGCMAFCANCYGRLWFSRVSQCLVLVERASETVCVGLR